VKKKRGKDVLFIPSFHTEPRKRPGKRGKKTKRRGEKISPSSPTRLSTVYLRAGEKKTEGGEKEERKREQVLALIHLSTKKREGGGIKKGIKKKKKGKRVRARAIGSPAVDPARQGKKKKGRGGKKKKERSSCGGAGLVIFAGVVSGARGVRKKKKRKHKKKEKNRGGAKGKGSYLALAHFRCQPGGEREPKKKGEKSNPHYPAFIYPKKAERGGEKEGGRRVGSARSDSTLSLWKMGKEKERDRTIILILSMWNRRRREKKCRGEERKKGERGGDVLLPPRSIPSDHQ